jgi:hypothetical protein
MAISIEYVSPALPLHQISLSPHLRGAHHDLFQMIISIMRSEKKHFVKRDGTKF